MISPETTAHRYATADAAEQAGVTVTHHILRPAPDDATQAAREACADRGHRHGCFASWLDVTFCECGQRRTAGNHYRLPDLVSCDAWFGSGVWCRTCGVRVDRHNGAVPGLALDALAELRRIDAEITAGTVTPGGPDEIPALAARLNALRAQRGYPLTEKD